VVGQRRQHESVDWRHEGGQRTAAERQLVVGDAADEAGGQLGAVE
jgi:hypothetical protein